MKVLQLANNYVKNGLYKHLFRELEARGVENSVFVPIKKDESAPEAPKNVDIVPCFGSFDRVLFYSKQSKILTRLETNYDLTSFDVIHAHTVFSAGFAAYQLHRKYGTPYVVAVRNTDINTFFKYMVHLRKLGVEIMRNARCVVFLSPAYMENTLKRWIPAKYREEIRKKSRVIPNGIAPLFFENLSEGKSAPQETIKLIYVGEISSNKNPELTICAAEKLIESGKTVSFKLIGQIKEEKYRGLLESKSFVTHIDKLPQEEIVSHLRESHIFVMPSHNETFGLVYAEAMSQGLPVLYTKGQGFDGYFEQGSVGFSVSDTDENDAAEKIIAVTQNYAQISKNCVESVLRFNWQDIAEEYVKLYASL